MSHWSSGLPVCFPSQGTQVQIPRGVLMWNRDSPVSVVLLHQWPPNVIDHFCGPVWGGLCPQPSLGPRTWSHTAFLSRFHARCSSSFQLHNRESAAGGEPCGEPAISLHFHHVSMVQWTTCLLPVTRTEVQIPGGYLCGTGILLLALSRYKFINNLFIIY